MRDIKFRVWCKDKKIMCDVNDIYEGLYEPDKLEIDIYNVEIGYQDYHLTRELDNIELMQYTGLKDNSNKEIYEDDIIRLWTHKDEENPENDKYEDYLVYWNDGAFVVNWENEYSCCDLGYAINCWEADSTEYKDWQVIGNKFNNPELLEEK